ncbi:glycosyltransferase [Candidatus Woesearchaeota archaeon]|nr:glycosyltransferase [Candidatus Woesearchaeota archaeon]
MKFSIIIPLAPERNCEVKKSAENLDFDRKEYEIIIKAGKNPSLNRNLGAKEAKGKILFFLDDDAFIKNDLLKKAEEFFDKYNVNIVGVFCKNIRICNGRFFWNSLNVKQV